MRIRWNKCNYSDIAEALKTIESMYDADLTCANVYFKLKKGDSIYSLFDLSTFEEATINMTKNIVIEKKFENVICISNDNIELIKLVMNHIDGWSHTNKVQILNFLVLKLAVLTNTQKRMISINNIEKIEEVVVLLFNSIGINPAEVLMPCEAQLEDEVKSIENMLNNISNS